MRIVVALGGNALLQRGEPPEDRVQRRHVAEAATELATLAGEHEVVVCHGNGPQVGLLAAESANDTALHETYPLDDLGAETQGLIGYWLVQEMHNAGVRPSPVDLLTRVLVDAEDPAFGAPTKFVGVGYDRETAQEVAARHGWTMADDGPLVRRVVASPRPSEVLELYAIELLLDAGSVVVCGGGGGVPCVRAVDGRLTGVEAVVDKDATASLLAVALGADALLVLTDVDGVLTDFGTDRARRIPSLHAEELTGSELPEGSMGPKVAACVTFAEATGRTAYIGSLGRGVDTLRGLAGTSVLPNGAPMSSGLG